MKIAYISYEYPPDSAYGGIATYVRQAAVMMSKRGHHVEVFTSSPSRIISELVEGVLVHRIMCISRDEFRDKIIDVFRSRHTLTNFDLQESPEYFADGYEIKKLYPDLPLVVKLHTPQFFIHEMTNNYVPLPVKWRYHLGALRRGKITRGFWKWKPKEDDVEFKIALLADQIHTPSISLGDIVSTKWNIPRPKIDNVPYPFIPPAAYLDIPVGGKLRVVTFVGRLEVRKGLVALAEAIPKVCRRFPDVKFKFVGKDLPSHIGGKSMKEFLIERLYEYKNNIEFLSVTSDQIPAVLNDTMVCVYPSIWENFPNVCLEAMSAGRAIVGSMKGGMKDMLTEPECGILIDPTKPAEIANGIIQLLEDCQKNEHYGLLARQQVQAKYNSEVIGSLMEKKYSQLVNK